MRIAPVREASVSLRTNRLMLLGQRALKLGHKFGGIAADLNNIVDEGKKWGKRKGRHKNSDKSILQHWKQLLNTYSKSFALVFWN